MKDLDWGSVIILVLFLLTYWFADKFDKEDLKLSEWKKKFVRLKEKVIPRR